METDEGKSAEVRAAESLIGQVASLLKKAAAQLANSEEAEAGKPDHSSDKCSGSKLPVSMSDAVQKLDAHELAIEAAKKKAVTKAHNKAYDEALKAANKDWTEMVAPAREVYLIQVAPIRSQYLQALAAAWQECDSAVASAITAFRAKEQIIRQPYVESMQEALRLIKQKRGGKDASR